VGVAWAWRGLGVAWRGRGVGVGVAWKNTTTKNFTILLLTFNFIYGITARLCRGENVSAYILYGIYICRGEM